mgnify:FL=1
MGFKKPTQAGVALRKKSKLPSKFQAMKPKRKKPSMLGAATSKTMLMNVGKDLVVSFGSGIAATKMNTALETTFGMGKDGKPNPNLTAIKMGATFVVGYLLHAFGNLPKVANGLVAGMAAVNSKNIGLGEDDEMSEAYYADQKALSEAPEFLNEQTGQRGYQQEDGTIIYV